jgi:hypothetical protein
VTTNFFRIAVTKMSCTVGIFLSSTGNLYFVCWFV